MVSTFRDMDASVHQYSSTGSWFDLAWSSHHWHNSGGFYITIVYDWHFPTSRFQMVSTIHVVSILANFNVLGNHYNFYPGMESSIPWPTLSWTLSDGQAWMLAPLYQGTSITYPTERASFLDDAHQRYHNSGHSYWIATSQTYSILLPRCIITGARRTIVCPLWMSWWC